MALTCRNIKQLHDAFVDRELSPSLTAEVHAHLLQCPACQQQVEMLRAVGDVIARDSVAPRLDSGFAQRVVAAIPKPVASVPHHRPLAWRTLTRAGLPVAAASILLAVLFWPQHHDASKTPRVLGMVAYKHVVDPAIDAVSDTQKAAENLKQLVEIGINQARADVKKGMEKAEARSSKANRPVFITDILLMPFDEVLNPPAPAPAEQSSGGDTVRF